MSTTYIAGIISIITLVLPIFGLEIADKETFAGLVTSIVGACSTAYIFIGRYKAGGINTFGIKKVTKK